MAIQRHKGLAEDVYEAVFNKLMTLDIAPGARITVDGLVRELEVSHTPIREALGRLEGEGLVVKTHLVGYSAAPQITRRRFDELYDFRLLLEPEAARRAALRISEENMAQAAEDRRIDGRPSATAGSARATRDLRGLTRTSTTRSWRLRAIA